MALRRKSTAFQTREANETYRLLIALGLSLLFLDDLLEGR